MQKITGFLIFCMACMPFTPSSIVRLPAGRSVVNSDTGVFREPRPFTRGQIPVAGGLLSAGDLDSIPREPLHKLGPA